MPHGSVDGIVGSELGNWASMGKKVLLEALVFFDNGRFYYLEKQLHPIYEDVRSRLNISNKIKKIKYIS
jgi:hypothetical protein